MKSVVAYLVIAAAAVSAQITLNTPSGATAAIQCEVYQVSWTGGTAPFDLRLNDASNTFVEELGSGLTSSPFQWTVNEPSGQQFSLVLIDSTGSTGLSGQFIIQTSSNSACLSASASTGGSSTAAASGSSTAASGSSTAAAGSSAAGSSTAGSSASKTASGSSTAASSTASTAGSSTSSSAAMHNSVGAGFVGALFAAAAALF